ncbi:MAG: DNA repair exonuclease [Sandaracinaceae bacterium]|nr:DNA repair exonuclease [Sandaracinaceae bacterium]
MRILFVSDTHLGFDLPARPRVERHRRGVDFFRNYERALAPALRGEADVVLHGGDLLFKSRVPASLVARALAPLLRVAEAGVPVMIVPGNHERGRIPYPLLAQHPRLHLFDRPRTHVLEARGVRVAFLGFPYARSVRARFPALLAEAERRREAPLDGRGVDHTILCVHHCVEGATCGPGDFTFRDGDDVIRRADLPSRLSLVLAGHIHRHQILGGPRPHVIYAGSVERTSFAEAPETKGFVRVELDASRVTRLAFEPLEARPMIARTLELEGASEAEARRRVAAIIGATPGDAVLQLRVSGTPSPATAWMSASSLRELGGDRNVSLVAPWTARPTPRRPPAPQAPAPHPPAPPPPAPPPAQLALFGEPRRRPSGKKRRA